MIRALALLFSCQLAGESLVRAIGLPVPGPVIGFALLAAGLLVARHFGGPTPEAVEDTALGRVAMALLGALGILFVPAGAGVVKHLDLVASHGVALVLVLVGSTVIALAVTVWVFVAASARTGAAEP